MSNCSIAALTLIVRRPGRPARTLRTAHGAAYELGMRERDHGVPIAPFADGVAKAGARGRCPWKHFRSSTRN